MINAHPESNAHPLEATGLAIDEIEYLRRKVEEGDLVAINHFIRGLNYTRGNDITLPEWREKALYRIRICRAASLLRGLADSLDSWTETS
jgi:hypothetical protein